LPSILKSGIIVSCEQTSLTPCKDLGSLDQKEEHDNGATVVESKDWEKRRLAYEIQDFREGLYHIVNVEANDDAALNEFDRLSKINGDILRHMIVKVDA